MTGAVLAVGGAESHQDNPVVLQTFLALAGGADAVIAVVSGASQEPEASYAHYRTTFLRLGAASVHWADDPDGVHERADWWPEVTGIFFGGGDQARLVSGIGLLYTRVVSRWEAGAVVGGSSAGAAALSRVMLAGGSARSPLNAVNLQFADGLGFWPEVIVDQHFSERRRLPRLLAAVIAHPDCVGIGIDENTAVQWEPGRGEASVLGAGTVTIVDARAANVRSGRTPIAVHVLTAGDRYRLESGEVAS